MSILNRIALFVLTLTICIFAFNANLAGVISCIFFYMIVIEGIEAEEALNKQQRKETNYSISFEPNKDEKWEESPIINQVEGMIEKDNNAALYSETRYLMKIQALQDQIREVVNKYKASYPEAFMLASVAAYNFATVDFDGDVHLWKEKPYITCENDECEQAVWRSSSTEMNDPMFAGTVEENIDVINQVEPKDRWLYVG